MFPQFGHSAPTMLSAASLLLISVLTTPESFIDWGWRIPFIASALLVAFGLYVRSRIEETPIFEREQERRGVVKAPLFEAFKAQPVAILRGAGVPLVAITFSYTASAFISNYGVDHLSLSRNQVIGATAVGGLMYTIFTLLGSVVSDRVGRKRILTSAQLAAAAWALCLFPILNTGTVFAYYLVLCLTFATAGAGYGAVGAFLPEQFKTRYRMSAIGVSYNLGGILGGGIIPLVAPVIIGSAGSTVFGIILAAICIISFACTASLKDVTTKSMEY
jgi:predicted MFS family arabinose efflux permease